MSVKLPGVIGFVLFLLGGGFMIFSWLGIPMLVLGILIGGWVAYGWLKLRRLGKLISKRVHVKFVKASFDSIGMSSPYVDFYFNIHSCLSHRLMLTGQKKGEIWNPHIEAWRSNWQVDTNYQDTVMPDIDTEIRVRWSVPQGQQHSPMTEFAFRAKDNPPEQRLTFEDMHIELKTRVLRLENNIGWLQLPQGIIPVIVPDHPVFSAVRREYLRQKNSE